MRNQNYYILCCGIVALWLLFLVLRGFVTKKPFLMSERWVTMVISLSFFGFSVLNALTGHAMLRWFFPVLFIVLGVILLFRPRGYVAYGVTDKSLRDGLLASLAKLNLNYEETPAGLLLPETGADLQVTTRSWWKTGCLKTNRREFDTLLTDIAKGMNEYYRSSPEQNMNMRYSIGMIAALILYILAAVWLLFFDS
jgi:hypothetical protein